MCPAARDRDVEERATRRLRPLADGKRSDRLAGPVVQGEHLVAGKPVEQPVLQHGERAADALLARLEDEMHGALEGGRGGEIPGSAQQHGGVAVVAAGVHQPRLAAAIRQVGLLLHRQAVHVGAQADRLAARAALQHADHAGLADAPVHLDAPLGELGRDDLRRAVLLQPDLRVGMQVAADGGQLIVKAADRLDGRHGLSHRLSPWRCAPHRPTWRAPPPDRRGRPARIEHSRRCPA